MIGITGSVGAEEVERHHHAVVERQLLGGGEIDLLGDAPRRAPARAARAPGTRRRGIFTNSSSVGPQNSSAMPMQKDGMWSRKKFAQCSGDTTTSTSGRAASSRARSSA